jgi:hypothetical protein
LKKKEKKKFIKKTTPIVNDKAISGGTTKADHKSMKLRALEDLESVEPDSSAEFNNKKQMKQVTSENSSSKMNKLLDMEAADAIEDKNLVRYMGDCRFYMKKSIRTKEKIAVAA